MTATYCIKNLSEDQFVSRGIASVEEVSKVLEVMSLHPGAVFLGKSFSHCYDNCNVSIVSDIGSNIGAYTVPVAAMGRSVVAVDMMLDNLGYIRSSLDTMDTASKVELVHNAVR